jgi:hypothetical protein
VIKGQSWLLRLHRQSSALSKSIFLDQIINTMLGSSSVLSLLALASTALSAPSGSIEKRAPTVYLAGDSTMATAKGAAGTLQGKHCITAAFIVYL